MQPIPGSAEFPNDNPLLHQGAVWICTRVRGSPRAVLRASPRAIASAPEPASVSACEPAPPVSEPAPAPAHTSGLALAPALVESSPPPAPELDAPESLTDPFADYVRAVVEVVLEAGCTRAAAALPAFLEHASTADFDATTIDLLVARGLAERSPSGAVPSAVFLITISVWRRVLRGEPADLSECGATMLDQWTAEFVATLLGAPTTRADDLRRQLRRKGVAAFGMLANAA